MVISAPSLMQYNVSCSGGGQSVFCGTDLPPTDTQNTDVQFGQAEPEDDHREGQISRAESAPVQESAGVGFPCLISLMIISILDPFEHTVEKPHSHAVANLSLKSCLRKH